MRPVPTATFLVHNNSSTHMKQRKSADTKPDGPVTLKEALSGNVKDQQRRSEHTASPEEAKRPAHERVRDAEKKSEH